jgi:hypothetical protein
VESAGFRLRHLFSFCWRPSRESIARCRQMTAPSVFVPVGTDHNGHSLRLVPPNSRRLSRFQRHAPGEHAAGLRKNGTKYGDCRLGDGCAWLT